jgi:hypothetical protein
MSLLRGQNVDGEILYAIAYEDWATRKAGFAYMHAKDRGDAVAKIILQADSNLFSKTTRIVNVAPAIGVFGKEIKKSIRVYGGL